MSAINEIIFVFLLAAVMVVFIGFNLLILLHMVDASEQERKIEYPADKDDEE